jgi:hypothetical protein
MRIHTHNKWVVLGSMPALLANKRVKINLLGKEFNRQNILILDLLVLWFLQGFW